MQCVQKVIELSTAYSHIYHYDEFLICFLEYLQIYFEKNLCYDHL